MKHMEELKAMIHSWLDKVSAQLKYLTQNVLQTWYRYLDRAANKLLHALLVDSRLDHSLIWQKSLTCCGQTELVNYRFLILLKLFIKDDYIDFVVIL
jgi:hypothetical protein